MKISVEMSLYPLSEDYRQRIIDFILDLKKNDQIEVITNGMSTQIYGDYDVVMNVLKKDLKGELEKHRSMFVLKIGAGEMKAESIAEELK